MKNRTSLLIMELLVMVLVFALAGALCLRMFVWAEQSVRDQAQRHGALLLAQNVAQRLKSIEKERPESVDQTETMFYDAVWEPCDPPGEYRLEVSRLPTAYTTLGSARIRVYGAGEAPLAQLDVNWQEVENHG
ncbi:MAG: hypothetical protein E7440_00475 [Ruminococcaceae bacterium]|nr:hypothetical protein [Oscillospiraceae bacterium]